MAWNPTSLNEKLLNKAQFCPTRRMGKTFNQLEELHHDQIGATQLLHGTVNILMT